MTETERPALRIGTVFRPQYAPETLAAAARAADDAGVDEMWLWEDCFASGGISAAGIALANSTTMAVGVGVLPAPMRNVALTAMEIATLERSFPGRVRIGVGHGVQDWMAQIGAKVASPMTYLREYLTCLTALLRGETVTYAGKYISLVDVCLEWPPNPNTELLAAAGGPKTLQLSGELASGTILSSGTTPTGVREALAHITSGRQKRSDAAPHSIVVYILCTTGPDADAEAVAEVQHWNFDSTQDVTAHGSANEIAVAARRWIDAGVDTIVLQPTADADIESFVRFIGTEVRPLLTR
ncbi:LLM class flavin-dependent oxidoreductase [Mycolicibacterium komossense]|uniref:LLM class flavin-dependent oxidoreductase n=1 Tax=Mycolicibacterium komossense TaxID=1779 RepID=A0ABT3CHG6_9MYCO|nr:LLM class flavin-dependent oxidoreductase [Mycolicibacterium komossense]MCV7228807.1 LLM class flavin-dependent oxidoreductase [Mycolicibacterium komossense]